MPTLDFDMHAFAVASKPKVVPVEIVGEESVRRREWTTIKLGKDTKSFRDKPIEEWNRKDMLKYVIELHYQTVGGKRIPFPRSAADGRFYYGCLEDVCQLLRTQLRVTDISHNTEKDYYDYVFKHCVLQKLATGVRFHFFWFKDETWVAKFVQARRQGVALREAPKVEVVEPAVASEGGLMLTSLDNAFVIGRAYFVRTYGPMVVANYLVVRKGKTEKEANDYLAAAMKKFANAPAEMEEMRAALKKYGPYPKWLPITSIEGVTEIELCDDSATLGCLKPGSKES